MAHRPTEDPRERQDGDQYRGEQHATGGDEQVTDKERIWDLDPHTFREAWKEFAEDESSTSHRRRRRRERPTER